MMTVRIKGDREDYDAQSYKARCSEAAATQGPIPYLSSQVPAIGKTIRAKSKKIYGNSAKSVKSSVLKKGGLPHYCHTGHQPPMFHALQTNILPGLLFCNPL